MKHVTMPINEKKPKSKYRPYEITLINGKWYVATNNGLEPFKTGKEAFVWADLQLTKEKGAKGL